MDPKTRFVELEYYISNAKSLYEDGKMEAASIYLENAYEELTELQSAIEELT